MCSGTLKFQTVGFNSSSVFVDLGSGLCKPQLQALAEHGVTRSVGVEPDGIKCQRAVQVIRLLAQAWQLDISGLHLVRAGAADLMTLQPGTHLYLCWHGWRKDDMRAVGRLVDKSRSIQCVCMVQPASRSQEKLVELTAELSFPPMQLVGQRGVVLAQGKSGPGRHLTAYTFRVMRCHVEGKQAGVESESLGLFDLPAYTPQVSVGMCLRSRRAQ